MPSFLTHAVCLQCGQEVTPNLASPACPACGAQWVDARYDYDAVARLWAVGLTGREASLWRYAELLPLDEPDPEISMREGYTPLLRLYPYERLYDQPHIYVKDERQGPTSSFKDRQAALAVTALRRAGINECVLASTGNAAAAYAAYCARAGIKLWLFLASLVPSEKMREAALYGAEVVKVSGTYDETKRVAAEFARRKGIYFDPGACGIPGKESMKTLAFEIAEQLAAQMKDGSVWRAPDWYIQAVSGGIGPLGVWKGFSELYQMGLIDKMPRLAIIQAAGCAPMVQAYTAGHPQAAPVVPRTLITVLATGDPGFSYNLLKQAVDSNNGIMLSVEDGETFEAMRRAASRAGLSVEPATAVAFAGLERMLSEAVIDHDEIVVLNCSGHTFPAESHVLGDQHLLNLELTSNSGLAATLSYEEGLGAALQGLDEQITTILVVDDNPNDRRLIRRLLRSYKRYRVFEARSGIEALKLVDEHKPDLVVADLTMPEMDGFTLLEQLKWNPATAHIPVVVVSAKTLTSDDRKLLERYSDSVWMKGGFTTYELVDHIVTILGDQPIDVARQPRDAVSEPERAAQPHEGDEPLHTVLLIDDNERDARLQRRLIETMGGYHVIEANTGRSGLKSVYEYHPDLIVLDLILPDMDGFTVLETLQGDANLREIPIIVCSGKDLSVDEQERLQTQVRALVEKSAFDRKRFVKIVNDTLS